MEKNGILNFFGVFFLLQFFAFFRRFIGKKASESLTKQNKTKTKMQQQKNQRA